MRHVRSVEKKKDAAGRPLEFEYVQLRPVPASEDKGWMESDPEVTIAQYYERKFGRLQYPHLPALDCTPKREAKMAGGAGRLRTPHTTRETRLHSF